MEAKSTPVRWTYAEFARLPTSGSTRYEIIADDLYVTPSPSLRHQKIVTELVFRLVAFVREHGLGELIVSPFDVLFAEGDYVEPDILFVRRDHTELLSDRGIEGPPDLVVEVVSPSTAARDRGVKLERYRHFGVPEYWVVDPEASTVEVWTGGEVAEGASLTGRLGDSPRILSATETLSWTPLPSGPTLEIEVAELFARD